MSQHPFTIADTNEQTRVALNANFTELYTGLAAASNPPSPAVDPLAALPFVHRFQTVGLKQDLATGIAQGSTLFQDAACTLSATTDGTAVAGCAIGGVIIAVQPTAGLRPILRLENGIPVLEFDGSKSLPSAAAISGTVRNAFFVCRAPTTTSGDSFQSSGRFLTGALRDGFPCFYPASIRVANISSDGSLDTTGLLDFTRVNGVTTSLVAPGYAVYAGRGQGAVAVNGIFSMGLDPGFAGFTGLKSRVIAYFLLGELTDAQFTLVENYCARLLQIVPPARPLESNYTLTVGALNGQNYRLYRPAAPSSGKLIIMGHGAGESAAVITLNSLGQLSRREVTLALLQDGHTVLASDENGDSWANQTSITNAAATASAVLQAYPDLAVTGVYGHSMGAAVGSNLIRLGGLPNVRAFYTCDGVFSLANLYGVAGFTESIKAAYGIASDGSDYASKTSGYDPLLASPAPFAGLMMRLLASPGDSVVSKAANTDAMAAHLGSTPSELSLRVTSGGHGDESHFIAQDVRSFFARM